MEDFIEASRNCSNIAHAFYSCIIRQHIEESLVGVHCIYDSLVSYCFGKSE